MTVSPGGLPTVRPVITGVGVVSPGGIGTEAHRASTLRNELKVAPVIGFNAKGYPARLGR
jgi:hypothetical protein